MRLDESVKEVPVHKKEELTNRDKGFKIIDQIFNSFSFFCCIHYCIQAFWIKGFHPFTAQVLAISFSTIIDQFVDILASKEDDDTSIISFTDCFLTFLNFLSGMISLALGVVCIIWCLHTDPELYENTSNVDWGNTACVLVNGLVNLW